MAVKVAAFTGGRDVPSARFRVRQYIEPLVETGIHVNEFCAPLSSYPPRNRLLRPAWAVASLSSRLPGMLQSWRYDLTLLQREILSTLMTLEPLSKRPRVLDVDDAIWLYRGGDTAVQLARRCEGVICGNSFLAEHFSQWNARVTIIPTAVDTFRYMPSAGRDSREKVAIGWIGTSSNYKYLYQVAACLASVLKQRPDAVLRVVSDTRPIFPAIPPDRVEFVQWSLESEVREIQNMAIGIMPLEQSVWARGKCSFKMLQYMACGVPVVVSPVGMNAEVLAMDSIGIGASTREEWVEGLLHLLSQPDERTRMGLNGRSVVEEHFSVAAVLPRLSRTLREFAA